MNRKNYTHKICICQIFELTGYQKYLFECSSDSFFEKRHQISINYCRTKVCLTQFIATGRTIWCHFPRLINAFCLDFIFVTLPQIIKFLFAPQKLDNFGAKTGRCSFLLDLGLGQSNLWDYLHYQHIVNLWSYPRICEIFSPEGRKVGNPISE